MIEMTEELVRRVNLVGFAAGALGVSIAVWLQLVSARDVDWRYVAGFLALGSTLMLMNLSPLHPPAGIAIGTRLVAHVALLAGQVWLGYRVWQNSETVRDAVTGRLGAGPR